MLSIQDAKQIYNLSFYLKSRRIRTIIGNERFRELLSNEDLRKLSYAELIDASYIIQNSYLAEIFENDNSYAKPIIATEQDLCFICKAKLKIHSATYANLYDDKTGKYNNKLNI